METATTEDDLIMMYFTGRLFELVSMYFKESPQEILSEKDFMYLKNKSWGETVLMFDIDDTEHINF